VEREIAKHEKRIEWLEASVLDLNGFEEQRYWKAMNKPKRKRRIQAAFRARQALSGNR